MDGGCEWECGQRQRAFGATARRRAFTLSGTRTCTCIAIRALLPGPSHLANTKNFQMLGYFALGALGASALLILWRKSLSQELLAHDERMRADEQVKRSTRKAVRVLLVRHGESAANVLGADYVAGRDETTPLSPTGEMQARLLGARLAAEKFGASKVFASHAARAHRTAELLCESAGLELPITTDKRVIEFSAGAFEKQKRPDAYTPAVLANMNARGPFYRPPGHSPDGVRGESQIDVQARMDDFLDDLLTQTGDRDAATRAQWATGDKRAPIDNVVVVAHGIAIRAFIRGVMGASHDFAIHSDVFNTSICELVYKPVTAVGKEQHGGWRLVRFNDHAHLQQELAQGRLKAIH